MDEDLRWRVSLHESGHAVAARLMGSGTRNVEMEIIGAAAILYILYPLLYYILLCVAVGMFAGVRRNRNEIGWFFLAILLSPPLAFIFVAILMPLPQKHEPSQPTQNRAPAPAADAVELALARERGSPVEKFLARERGTSLKELLTPKSPTPNWAPIITVIIVFLTLLVMYLWRLLAGSPSSH
jgi:hypothetical protein